MSPRYKTKEARSNADARNKAMFDRAPGGFIPVEVAAELTNYGRMTIYRWIYDESVGSAKYGKFLYVSLADLAKKVPDAFGKKDPKTVAGAVLFPKKTRDAA